MALDSTGICNEVGTSSIFLVVTSYIGLLIGPSMGSITSLLRIVRTARLFRLIKMSKGLTALFQTLLGRIAASDKCYDSSIIGVFYIRRDWYESIRFYSIQWWFK